MQVDGFDDGDTYNTMRRNMRAAGAKDRKQRQRQGLVNANFARGESEANRPDHVQCESVQWMVKMRGLFKGHVIRRDNKAKDFEGKSIVKLDSYIYQLMELNLTEREMTIMNQRLEELRSSDRRVDGEVSVIYQAQTPRCTQPRMNIDRVHHL